MHAGLPCFEAPLASSTGCRKRLGDRKQRGSGRRRTSSALRFSSTRCAARSASACSCSSELLPRPCTHVGAPPRQRPTTATAGRRRGCQIQRARRHPKAPSAADVLLSSWQRAGQAAQPRAGQQAGEAASSWLLDSRQAAPHRGPALPLDGLLVLVNHADRLQHVERVVHTPPDVFLVVLLLHKSCQQGGGGGGRPRWRRCRPAAPPPPPPTPQREGELNQA
jgi:hypothetical protein